MRCPQCKAEVAIGSLFCNKCGGPLDQHDPAVAGTESEAEAAAETPMEKFKEAASSRVDTKEEVEVELWRGGYSPKAMIGNWIASGLIGVMLLVIAFVWLSDYPLTFWVAIAAAFLPALYSLVVLGYRKLSVHYLLTNQRFIHESGFLSRTTNRIEVLDMDDISFEQGLVERMLGVGTIRIHSSDVSHPELFLRGIDNVAEISNLLDNTRRGERRKRGLHIESI
jgi:uncharacterized membrane protein YdbT with pleckstrin-like domain